MIKLQLIGDQCVKLLQIILDLSAICILKVSLLFQTSNFFYIPLLVQSSRPESGCNDEQLLCIAKCVFEIVNTLNQEVWRMSLENCKRRN